jgi:serine/threonine protein phosphatase PrpC
MPAIWTALSASVRGATHERDGRTNQDAVRMWDPRSGAESLFLAVSDGHGSLRSFRSDRGSAIATNCALRLLQEFERRGGADMPLSSIRRHMQGRWSRDLVAAWHQAVREDVARDPFSPFDFAAFPEQPPTVKPGVDLPFSAYLAYGATLIVAAVTRRHIIYAQLGDGDILTVRADGRVSRPWPSEHSFFANETISLCSQHAERHFTVKVEPRGAEAPALILLATDGYANCFENDRGFFRVGADLLDYLREGGPSFVREKLEPWLRDSSRDGSGDDITVALAVRRRALSPRVREEEPVP